MPEARAVALCRAREREAELKASREALRLSTEDARRREAERKKEAEEHRRIIRERAADYRANKQLAKTSAFAR